MVIVMSALVAVIASYGILQVAVNQARRAGFYRKHTRGQYAAEAGLVWAQQQLWNNPAYCGNPQPPAIDGINVTVIVTAPAGCAAGNPRTIQTKVTNAFGTF